MINKNDRTIPVRLVTGATVLLAPCPFIKLPELQTLFSHLHLIWLQEYPKEQPSIGHVLADPTSLELINSIFALLPVVNAKREAINYEELADEYKQIKELFFYVGDNLESSQVATVPTCKILSLHYISGQKKMADVMKLMKKRD